MKKTLYICVLPLLTSLTLAQSSQNGYGLLVEDKLLPWGMVSVNWTEPCKRFTALGTHHIELFQDTRKINLEIAYRLLLKQFQEYIPEEGLVHSNQSTGIVDANEIPIWQSETDWEKWKQLGNTAKQVSPKNSKEISDAILSEIVDRKLQNQSQKILFFSYLGSLGWELISVQEESEGPNIFYFKKQGQFKISCENTPKN